MADHPKPDYFIVRHGLDALKAHPNLIWNDEKKSIPRGYKQVKIGDRWIGFAFTTSDNQEKFIRQVVSFNECTEMAIRKPVDNKLAWVIEGKALSKPLPCAPVPALTDSRMLDRFTRNTITKITKPEFDRISMYAKTHKLDPNKIPLLCRAPENEQELLAIVVSEHERFGIKKILRIGKAFPDLFVEIEGGPSKVHLELELCSSGFCGHGHNQRCQGRCFDGKPVAILCWDNDDKDEKAKSCVHDVFELKDLIRKNEKIRW